MMRASKSPNPTTVWVQDVPRTIISLLPSCREMEWHGMCSKMLFFDVYDFRET